MTNSIKLSLLAAVAVLTLGTTAQANDIINNNTWGSVESGYIHQQAESNSEVTANIGGIDAKESFYGGQVRDNITGGSVGGLQQDAYQNSKVDVKVGSISGGTEVTNNSTSAYVAGHISQHAIYDSEIELDIGSISTDSEFSYIDGNEANGSVSGAVQQYASDNSTVKLNVGSVKSKY